MTQAEAAIRHIKPNMQVSVYKNLRKGCFSIRACGGPANGRVIAHADRVTLGDVVFHVGKFGQHKVRKTGHKNVHAFVTGSLIGWAGPRASAFGAGEFVLAPHLGGFWDGEANQINAACLGSGEAFTYNPYQHDGFVSKVDGRILHGAACAVLCTTYGNRACVCHVRNM